jgi:molybdopterin-guanine dinucleotide biosynthesis protein B
MKVFGIAGFSGSGKTTLIEKLIPELRRRNLAVSVVKHTHHDFDLDRPGKDSFRHRAAGAGEVLLAGGARWALLHENRAGEEPPLTALLARLAPCDLVLVEGFKREAIDKLEVHRPALGRPPLFPDDPRIVAVAADGPLATALPVIDLNAVAVVAEFICRHMALPVHPQPRRIA